MKSNDYTRLKQQFELSRANVGNNVLTMEGMRGFAVFLVFLVHYSSLCEPWIFGHTSISIFARALHSIGNTGVDLFFVLSGYLIYGSLISRQQSFLKFIKRRVKRIYPAFSAVFLLYLALSFFFPAESKIPRDGSSIYLIQNFILLPGIFKIEPLIAVAWSLSYEMFYCLLMPLAVLALQLRTRSAEWRVLAVALLSVLTAYWCANIGGHLRLIMFMAGIFLYEAVSSGKVSQPLSRSGLLALVIGLLVMLVPISWNIKIGVLFASFYFFCLCCFLRPNEWLARWFSWTPLRWLGNMSYSYYLLHGLALKAFFLILGKFLLPNGLAGEGLFFLLIPITFLLTLIPTTMLFLFVERPFSLPSAKPVMQSEQRNEQVATFLSQ